jgi:hypothetical protein
LDSRIPWKYLVEFVDATRDHPEAAATALTRALDRPVLTRSGIVPETRAKTPPSPPKRTERRSA